MGKLIIFNLILIALISLGLWLVKKCVKKERTQNIILIAAAIFTIVFHYSSFVFKLLSGGNAIEYLGETPNLILPIYPCNVVMWSALIFALLKNKKSRVGSFFVDYLFWFGIISTLVGMFANVDFINNPTLTDYLINALAFEAEWTEIYEKDQVRDKIFTKEDGTKQDVELMYSTEGEYLKHENANWWYVFFCYATIMASRR